jgi:lysophospholipase L1-like esterase
MRILCYGDSNTWGFAPVPEPPSTRLPPDDRWPRALAAALGGDGGGGGVEVIEEGLNGRTTDIADPTHPDIGGAGLDGLAYLPACLASHLPLDIVVIMLGTNDLKAMFARSAARIALGAGRLAEVARGIGGGVGTTYVSPDVLLVCPPPLAPMTYFAEVFAGGHATSAALPAAYRAVAEAVGVGFLDAGTVIATDGVDGLHLTGATQRRLGAAVAARLRQLFPDRFA